MISREDILQEALHKCFVEMYRWAQPSIDLDELIKKGFKDSEKDPLYTRHYLSQDNFKYIRDTYMDAYGIKDTWNDTFEILIKQLLEGGIEDDYKEATPDKPAYRDYKKVLPLKEVITCPEEVNTIIDYIKKCQNFYKGHCYETNKFSCSIALGPSPNCNAKHVTEYWHSHGKPEFKIVEYNISDVIYGDGDFEEVSDEEFLTTLRW